MGRCHRNVSPTVAVAGATTVVISHLGVSVEAEPAPNPPAVHKGQAALDCAAANAPQPSRIRVIGSFICILESARTFSIERLSLAAWWRYGH